MAKPSMIHIVDLDGAIAGKPQHLELLRKIKHSTGLRVQFGGGVRDLASLESIFEIGIDRVVLGTVAIENPKFVEEAIVRFGETKICAGIDAKNGIVAIKGWVESGNMETLDLIYSMAEIGVKRFIYTDISRDGTLSSPNFDAIAQLLISTSKVRLDLNIIASGGIANLMHLHQLANIGVEGAIVGSALYTGELDLGAAVIAMQNY